MKWVHPKTLGATIKETLAEALGVDPWYLCTNSPYYIHWVGCCSWSCHAKWDMKHPLRCKLHSWNTMRDCCKYGFTVRDDGEVYANDPEKGKTTNGH